MAQTRLRSIVQGRGLFLLPVAAFAVHQLRYTLAYGSRADQVMAMQGHSYLNSLAPWLVLLRRSAPARSPAHRAGAPRRRRRSPAAPLPELWGISWEVSSIYVVQGALEGPLRRRTSRLRGRVRSRRLVGAPARAWPPRCVAAARRLRDPPRSGRSPRRPGPARRRGGSGRLARPAVAARGAGPPPRLPPSAVQSLTQPRRKESGCASSRSSSLLHSTRPRGGAPPRPDHTPGEDQSYRSPSSSAQASRCTRRQSSRPCTRSWVE